MNVPVNAVLLRFGEVFLKRMRKGYFLGKLQRSVKHAIRDIEGLQVLAPYGRLLVATRPDENGERPPLAERLAPTLDALGRVFGLESFSPAVFCARDMDTFAENCVTLARWEMERRPGIGTFRIRTNRADKSFPGRSSTINAELGGPVLEAFPDLRVKLDGADMELGVEIRADLTCVWVGRQAGPGGLPVGSNRSALLMLSGGIDSPVAGWLTMKRGVRIDALYFHSFPFTGEQTRLKVLELARELTRWQGPLWVHVAPFTAFQQHCRDLANPRLLVLLYRRQMMRVSEAIARRHGHRAIVTGEAIGQVASQTLDNLGAISAVATMPIIRPLATYDKQETIRVARRIGTYETSILPFDDCCSLFVPPHPEVAGTPEQLAAEEEKLEIEVHLEQILSGIESTKLP